MQQSMQITAFIVLQRVSFSNVKSIHVAGLIRSRPDKQGGMFKMEMDDRRCKARYPQFLRPWPNLIIGNTTTPLLQTVAIATKLPDSWPLKKLTKTAGSSILGGHISLCSF
ncbi:hypothetical protein AMECASPLE_008916 [Ameca splendens]|uniref:Uncharacterized protein n=1 Tax=Ameca splendens TaxID=208324 RepID=A0ABV0XP15_9TELE